MRAAALFVCLLTLHAPGGAAFYVESSAIVAIRPIDENYKEHVAEGTRAVVYTIDKNFAVEELSDELIHKMRSCEPP